MAFLEFIEDSFFDLIEDSVLDLIEDSVLDFIEDWRFGFFDFVTPADFAIFRPPIKASEGI